jgi:ABC-type sugar transport system ATPase subunit
LDVERGEIVALLGANGSGKSTTVKAITGVNAMDPRTDFTLNGSPVKVTGHNTSEARRVGIRVVHQEAPLIADMTVAEMTALHVGFPQTNGLVRERRLLQTTRAILSAFDIDTDPSVYCGELSTGERALISLAISMAGIEPERALLILDEATASLSTTESGRLLDRVEQVVKRGLAVVMVTHRLPEVKRYCDKTLVLRDGRIVSTFTRENYADEDVIHAMVGSGHAHRSAESRQRGESVGAAAPRLVATNLSGPGIDSVTLSLRAGEILGVTGRAGDGPSELLRLLGGLERPTSGTLEVQGRAVKLRAPRDAVNAGVYYLSPDRLTEGGVPLMTVHDNMVLPHVERYGLSRRKAVQDVASMMNALSVQPPSSAAPFGSLSGGNQQKVLLARWLLLDPSVLILDDPTAGVDPTTRETIFRTLNTLAAQGVSIVLRSTEPEHLERLCDRALVLREGRIVSELSQENLTIEEISLATYT